MQAIYLTTAYKLGEFLMGGHLGTFKTWLNVAVSCLTCWSQKSQLHSLGDSELLNPLDTHRAVIAFN